MKLELEDLIATIESEIDNSTSTDYKTKEGNCFTTDVGYVYEWFEEYKEILRNRCKEPEKMKLECPNCHKEMIDDYFMLDVKRIKNGLPYKYDARIITCYDCYDRLFNASEKEFGEERK